MKNSDFRYQKMGYFKTTGFMLILIANSCLLFDLARGDEFDKEIWDSQTAGYSDEDSDNKSFRGRQKDISHLVRIESTTPRIPTSLFATVAPFQSDPQRRDDTVDEDEEYWETLLGPMSVPTKAPSSRPVVRPSGKPTPHPSGQRLQPTRFPTQYPTAEIKETDDAKTSPSGNFSVLVRLNVGSHPELVGWYLREKDTSTCNGMKTIVTLPNGTYSGALANSLVEHVMMLEEGGLFEVLLFVSEAASVDPTGIEYEICPGATHSSGCAQSLVSVPPAFFPSRKYYLNNFVASASGYPIALPSSDNVISLEYDLMDLYPEESSWSLTMDDPGSDIGYVVVAFGPPFGKFYATGEKAVHTIVLPRINAGQTRGFTLCWYDFFRDSMRPGSYYRLWLGLAGSGVVLIEGSITVGDECECSQFSMTEPSTSEPSPLPTRRPSTAAPTSQPSMKATTVIPQTTPPPSEPPIIPPTAVPLEPTRINLPPTPPPMAGTTPVPTRQPTTASPTPIPTSSPTTGAPAVFPTTTETGAPTNSPTTVPTGTPTTSPPSVPTESPTSTPTVTPTVSPTSTPTRIDDPTPTPSVDGVGIGRFPPTLDPYPTGNIGGQGRQEEPTESPTILPFSHKRGRGNGG